MNAYIKVKSGDTVLVSDISAIKKVPLRKTDLEDVHDMENFIFTAEHYVFIGDNTVSINGSEISYVNFKKRLIMF